jgi:hypothetical protein
MLHNKSNNVYTNIGNQLVTGNNIPIAEPVVDNSIQELEKEIARLKNNNKLLNSKLTERDRPTLTLNKFLSKYNFHEIYGIIDAELIYSTMEALNLVKNRQTFSGTESTSLTEEMTLPPYIGLGRMTITPSIGLAKTTGPFVKEHLILYFESCIYSEQDPTSYKKLSNINDITHLYYYLIEGGGNYKLFDFNHSYGGSFSNRMYTRLIKLLSQLDKQNLLPEGLTPIDKICLCDTKNILDIDGNQCDQCDTDYIDYMFETSGWDRIFSDKGKIYFYEMLKSEDLNYSDFITLIVCNERWADVNIYLTGSNEYRYMAGIRFARIFSNIAKLTFRPDLFI